MGEMNLNRYKKIVCYHSIKNAENFEKHVRYLKANDVLITFDDGCTSVYDIAFPILKKHNVEAILFVITSLIDTDNPFWWDEIRYYDPENGEARVWEVKKWPDTDRREFLKKLRAESNKPLLKQKQLITSQLQEMQENGIVIGNHSHSHPMLDQCSDEGIREELRQSANFFRERRLDGFHYFAYPNGNSNLRTEKILAEQGVRFAFLFDHAINDEFNPMRISRLSVNDHTSMWKLRFITSGLHSAILPFRKKIRRLMP
jgi:poly-beta-1,6-N-acetyl-D-glucosamine N-deacetylase